MPLGYVAAGPELHWVINFLPHCSHSASHRADVACLRTDPLDSRACLWNWYGCTCTQKSMLRQCWGGVGVKFLHIERKKTSVAHSHPPSHYMRTHALGWPYWFHALHAGQFQCMCPSHLGRPCRVSAFAALHHLQAFNWRSAICHLWHPAESQGFCEELWIAEPNIAFTHTSDRCVLEEVSVTQLHIAFLLQVTLVLWGVSHMTQYRLYLQCSLVNIWLSSSFETSRRFLRGVEKETASGKGWQHHMWTHTDLWTQDALYLRKHNESEPEESGTIPAARVFIEKNKGLRERSAASHINLQ